jgi:predicted amidohydrolase YtcJ
MTRLVFENGPIYAMDGPPVLDGALAVEGDTVAFLGPRDACPRAPVDRSVDLAGRPLLPAFCDSHLHLALTAEMFSGIDASGVASVEELARRVGAAARAVPPGGWVTGFGWEKKRIFDDRVPALDDIDGMAPRHRVFLVSRDLHGAWLNTRALGELDALETPPSKCVVHCLEGRRTGLVHEGVIDLRRLLCGREHAGFDREALASLFGRLHAHGITTVHDIETVEDLARMHGALAAAPRRLRVAYSVVFKDPEELHARRESFKASSPGWLAPGGVKLFLDGSFGSLTAAVSRPYAGTADDRGILNLTDDELDRWLAAIREAGTHGVFHAIGDRAVDQALRRIARLVWPSGTTHRIEHAQLLSTAVLDRSGVADVVFSVQPSHMWGDREIVARHMIDDRYAFAYGTMRDRGAGIVFGSDAPVEDTDPWPGICAAVTRTGVDGAEPWNPAEALTVREALAAHTSGPARLHAGLGTGVLREGAPADLVVLDRDPFEVPPPELRDVCVDVTVCAGEVVYERASAPA